MQYNSSNISKAHYMLYIGGILCLIIYLLTESTVFLYDEPYYLKNVSLIDEFGLTRPFIENLAGPAGPLHSVVHWILRPITRLEVVPVRLVNVVFLGVSILALGKLLQLLDAAQAALKALSIIAIPMVFPCAGMALTEMPALCCLTLSLLVLELSIKRTSVGLAILGGLLLSLAISGRQPYLLVVGILPVFLLYRMWREPGRLLIVATFSFFSLLLPVALFLIWGGLVPHEGGDIATRGGLEPVNIFLALGYSFLISLILASNLFRFPKGGYLLAYFCLWVLVFGGCYIWDVSFLVMRSTVESLLPGGLIGIYGYAMAALLICLGVYFVISLLQLARRERANCFLIFSIGSLLVILLSSLAITHQFSSRYVFQAAPLFIIVLSRYMHFDRKSFALRIVGIVLGFLSLYSYLN